MKSGDLILKLIDLIIDVLMPLLSTTFRLFHGGQWLLVEEAGVLGENHDLR